MKWTIYLLFQLSSISLLAQFGLSYKYQANNFEDWKSALAQSKNVPQADLFDRTYGVGLDYWIRFKNVRIEIYPELNYSFGRFTVSQAAQTYSEKYEMQVFGVGTNWRFYILDFFSDCECPTFSKQSGFFRKGFFFHVGVHGRWQNKTKSLDNVSQSHGDLSYQFEGGVGIDFGLSDLITISPYISGFYSPRSSWVDLVSDNNVALKTTNLGYLVGIRIGFRPDYLKKNRF